MKKILCVLMAVTLLIGCCVLTASATDTETLNLANDVQARYEGLIEGISPEPIVRTLHIEDSYDFSNWISVGLIDYSICREHGTNCPNQRSITAENGFFLEFTEGGEYVQAEHRVADLGGWSAVQVKLSFTDAVKEADLPVFVRGSFYFGYEPESENGCKMKGMDFVFTVISRNEQYSEEELVAPDSPETLPSDVDINDLIHVVPDPDETEPPTKEEEPTGEAQPDVTEPADNAPLMQWGYDVQTEFSEAAAAINAGSLPNTIYRAVSISKKYGAQPLAEMKTLGGIICRIDQQQCDALAQITVQDIQLQLTSGEELADIALEKKDGVIYWTVSPTQAGKQIKNTAEVSGSICVMKTADGKVHISQEIPFVLTLVKEPSSLGIPEMILIAVSTVLLCGIVIVLVAAKGKKRKNK